LDIELIGKQQRKTAVSDHFKQRSIAPKVLEPRRRQIGVADGVLDVAVAKVSLKRSGVMPLIGQRVTAALGGDRIC
jgi:hypothetical protein